MISVYPGSAVSGRTRLARFNPSAVSFGRQLCPGYPVNLMRSTRRSEAPFLGEVPALRIRPLTGGRRNRERHIWLDFAELDRVSFDHDLAGTSASWLGTAATDLAFGTGGLRLRSHSFTTNKGEYQP